MEQSVFQSQPDIYGRTHGSADVHHHAYRDGIDVSKQAAERRASCCGNGTNRAILDARPNASGSRKPAVFALDDSTSCCCNSRVSTGCNYRPTHRAVMRGDCRHPEAGDPSDERADAVGTIAQSL